MSLIDELRDWVNEDEPRRSIFAINPMEARDLIAAIDGDPETRKLEQAAKHASIQLSLLMEEMSRATVIPDKEHQMKVSIPSHTQIIAASATAGPADSPTNWVDLDLEGHEITFFTTSAEQARRIADAFNWNPGTVAVDDGVALIAAERKRQVESEGWTPEHDDTHKLSEITRAATAYTLLASKQAIDDTPAPSTTPPPCWPWHNTWWKPAPEPIRNLVKAGALIAAEIDRLRRRAGEAVAE